MAELENDFSVRFNNFDLNSINYVHFVRRNPNNEGDIVVTSHDLVRRDGRVITGVKRDRKQIPVEGYIIAPSRTAYEEALDELKFRTAGVERPLVIQQSGSSRRYTATKENIVVEHIEGGRARVNISFVASQPFGEEDTLTTMNFTATTTPFQISHEFGGTAPARPNIILTLNSGTDLTNKYIGIGNSSTSQQVQVTRNWTAGDVVRFDMNALKMYVNDVQVDYSGVFSEFRARSTQAYYYDNFTDRNVSGEMYYRRRFY